MRLVFEANSENAQSEYGRCNLLTAYWGGGARSNARGSLPEQDCPLQTD